MTGAESSDKRVRRGASHVDVLGRTRHGELQVQCREVGQMFGMTAAAARRQNEAEAVSWAPRGWHLDPCLACLSVTVLVPVQDPRPQIHGQCLSFCSIIAGNTTQNMTDALHVKIRSGCHATSWSGVNWTPCAPGTSLVFFPPQILKATLRGDAIIMLILWIWT